MTPAYSPHTIHSITPLRDTIIVTDMSFSERITSGGIILPVDDMKSSGIRPRACRVLAVGPQQQDVTPGQWLLVEHGRWSRGIDVALDSVTMTIRKVDPSSILLVSDEPIEDTTMSDCV